MFLPVDAGYGLNFRKNEDVILIHRHVEAMY